jgi:hypothetical protein
MTAEKTTHLEALQRIPAAFLELWVRLISGLASGFRPRLTITTGC